MENNNSIKIAIQPIDVKMNPYLERKIQRLLTAAKNVFPQIHWADIYLKSNSEVEQPRTVVVRLGIPGSDVMASDTGRQWKQLLKNVEKRILRQLEKRKTLLGRTAV